MAHYTETHDGYIGTYAEEAARKQALAMKDCAINAPARQTPLSHVISASNEIHGVENRLREIVERLVGSEPEVAGDSPPRPYCCAGLLGEVGVVGARICDASARMHALLARIERVLP